MMGKRVDSAYTDTGGMCDSVDNKKPESQEKQWYLMVVGVWRENMSTDDLRMTYERERERKEGRRGMETIVFDPHRA